MQPKRHFSAAPWPTCLKITSLLGCALLLGVGYAAFVAIPRDTRVPFAETFGTLIAFVTPTIALTAALFLVSGYELDGRCLLVRRLLWATPVSLTGIRKTYHDPAAMKRSLRVFGNGGLLSITGIYKNKSLGWYRAFVTDPSHAVVLVLPNRVVVISPSDPLAFIQQLRSTFPEIYRASQGAAA
jgi:hypothetical protein